MDQDQAYNLFERKVHQLTGIDLSGYKCVQMQRRLQTIMKRFGVNNYQAYGALLERDPVALKEFRDFVTINVSEFFRNPEKFEELKTKIFPVLLMNRPDLKIWSAGCSNGSEPYTVSILLEETDQRGNHQILATDLDREILKVAQAGCYQEKDLKSVAPERLGKFFIRLPGGQLQVKPNIKSRVTFKEHNLLCDPFDPGFDLIICRNVVIYFTEPVKDQLYRRFYDALRPGGVLFVGGTESLLNSRAIGFEPIFPFFYRKAV